MTDLATVPGPGDRCPDSTPHGPHEWYGTPAVFRRECPGVPQPGDHTPAGFGAADTADEALLTDAEWDALGRAVVPTWDDETPLTKKIWRGFRMDLARGYRLGLAAGEARGRTAAAADLAATFRSAAIHRREYMGVGEKRHDELLSTEVVTLESAAKVADGDLGPLYMWLPSWRWTDEMNARLDARLDAKDPTDD